MPSSSRWRLLITRTAGGAVACVALEMASSSGGANECTGGTASASSNSATASNAFDGNVSTFWTASSATFPQWIEYNFGSSKSIVEVRYTIRTGNTTTRPEMLELQYYDGSAWVTSACFSESRYWFGGSTKAFRVLADPGPNEYYHWRVRETDTFGLGNLVVSEMLFRETAGGADLADASNVAGLPISTLSSSDTRNPYRPIGSTGDYSAASYPAFLGYRFDEPRQLVQIAIRAGSSVQADLCYKQFVIEASNTGRSGEWTTLYTSAVQSVWSSNELRTFTIAYGAEGNLAVTEANDSLTAEGDVAVIATLSVTEDSDALDAGGSVPVAASLEITDDDDALASYGQSGAGVIGGLGDLFITENDDGLAAVGVLDVIGDVAVLEDHDTLAAFVLSGTNGPFTRRPVLVLN